MELRFLYMSQEGPPGVVARTRCAWLPRHFVTAEGCAPRRLCRPQDSYIYVSILFPDLKASFHRSHSSLVCCSDRIRPQAALCMAPNAKGWGRRPAGESGTSVGLSTGFVSPGENKKQRQRGKRWARQNEICQET